MVATKNALWVAGPDDVSDEGDLFYRDAKERVRAKEADLTKQAALWRGESGSTLLAISKQNGKKLFEYHLEALPVFDGAIAQAFDPTASKAAVSNALAGSAHCQLYFGTLALFATSVICTSLLPGLPAALPP